MATLVFLNEGIVLDTEFFCLSVAVVTLGEFKHSLVHLTIVNEVVSVTGILRLTIVN